MRLGAYEIVALVGAPAAADYFSTFSNVTSPGKNGTATM
jgi:hypothetical protein